MNSSKKFSSPKKPISIVPRLMQQMDFDLCSYLLLIWYWKFKKLNTYDFSYFHRSIPNSTKVISTNKITWNEFKHTFPSFWIWSYLIHETKNPRNGSKTDLIKCVSRVLVLWVDTLYYYHLAPWCCTAHIVIHRNMVKGTQAYRELAWSSRLQI